MHFAQLRVSEHALEDRLPRHRVAQTLAGRDDALHVLLQFLRRHHSVALPPCQVHADVRRGPAGEGAHLAALILRHAQARPRQQRVHRHPRVHRHHPVVRHYHQVGFLRGGLHQPAENLVHRLVAPLHVAGIARPLRPALVAVVGLARVPQEKGVLNFVHQRLVGHHQVPVGAPHAQERCVAQVVAQPLGLFPPGALVQQTAVQVVVVRAAGPEPQLGFQRRHVVGRRAPVVVRRAQIDSHARQVVGQLQRLHPRAYLAAPALGTLGSSTAAHSPAPSRAAKPLLKSWSKSSSSVS